MRDRGFRAVLRERVRDFFTNWSAYDASFLTKLGLTFRNRFKAFFSTQQCCGNHGQPGC